MILLGEHLADHLADAFELEARRHAVGASAVRQTGLDLLLDAADADHEEFVEVRCEDGQELEPFQQRHARIAAFLQDPTIEFEPAQVAVEIERRVVQSRN